MDTGNMQAEAQTVIVLAIVVGILWAEWAILRMLDGTLVDLLRADELRLGEADEGGLEDLETADPGSLLDLLEFL